MIGGLGGFVLPIAFGALSELTGIWTSCLMVLGFALIGALLLMLFLRTPPVQPRPLQHATGAQA